MKLHEIDLHSKDMASDKHIFQDLWGLKLHINQNDLLVFDSGKKGLDLDVSNHFPEVKISLSFLVEDLSKYMETLNNAGIPVSQPCGSHLGLQEIKFCTSEGVQIILHSPTADFPEWINEMV
jgi:hypothetical protein